MPPKASTVAAVRFSRFDGGDYGVLAGFRAPKDTYSGMDVQAFLDGSIGPRAGVTTFASPGMPNGKVAGMGFFNQDAGTAVPWFIVGTAAYASVTAPAALIGALTSTPTLPVCGIPIGAFVYATNYGDKLYKLSTTNCDPLALAPGGAVAAGFGDRLLVANFPGNANRVKFSAANDFTSWPPLNFFDVGQGGAIVGMWTVRTSIYIAKNDGSWWIYSGVPGSGSDVLRLAYTGLGYPNDWRSGAVIGGSNIWFVAKGENFPSYFNGSNVGTFPEQDTLGQLYSSTATDVDPLVSVVALSRRGDALLLAGKGLVSPNRINLLYRDSKWSRHSIPYPLGAAVPGDTRVLLCDGGGVGIQATFAWWLPTSLERPGLGGTYDAITDANLTGNLSLPEFVNPDGADMRVTKLLINFRRFNQAVLSNRFNVQVTATRRADQADDKAGTSRLFDQPSTFGTSTGRADRYKVMCVDQDWGTGWRVDFTQLRGVVVDEVVVYYEKGAVRV